MSCIESVNLQSCELKSNSFTNQIARFSTVTFRNSNFFIFFFFWTSDFQLTSIFFCVCSQLFFSAQFPLNFVWNAKTRVFDLKRTCFASFIVFFVYEKVRLKSRFSTLYESDWRWKFRCKWPRPIKWWFNPIKNFNQFKELSYYHRHQHFNTSAFSS